MGHPSQISRSREKESGHSRRQSQAGTNQYNTRCRHSEARHPISILNEHIPNQEQAIETFQADIQRREQASTTFHAHIRKYEQASGPVHNCYVLHIDEGEEVPHSATGASAAVLPVLSRFDGFEVLSVFSGFRRGEDLSDLEDVSDGPASHFA
jgi:hypothetical protein